jgi:NADH-quinone oxidoreductase subunit C
MTVALFGQEIASKIAARFPNAVDESNHQAIVIKSESFLKVAEYLKNSPELQFNLLVDITSVDYWDYFELVYRLTSLEHNHSLILKLRCYGREKPEVPSLTGLWKGADMMEREVFDLMGISFKGHPRLKRVFLWEGFNGHPLRKDYI